MYVADLVRCPTFPCADVVHPAFTVPGIEIEADRVRIAMISEAPPLDPADWFYAPGEPFFLRTTLEAFRSAGADVSSMQDIIDSGVYVTTAVKCAKTGYGVKAGTIVHCSQLLEAELAQFPNLVAILLMGDVAIKALNAIARRRVGKRAIPAGSTYKIRGPVYELGGTRLFPSYLQTGRSYLIEKSKRRMIAEDIRAALTLVG